MPRPKSETSALVADLTSRIAQVVDAARRQGRDEALGHIRNLVAGGAAPKRGPGRPRKDGSVAPTPTKSGRPRKNPWAKLSPAARLARVNAIRKGKGLPPREA